MPVRHIFACLAAASLPASPIGAQDAAALSGMYDGGAPEIAAGLELRPDGRFRYGLSYGGLDEQAEGRWQVADGTVLLTSDPVTPPRFVLVSQQARSDDRVQVLLDLPKGMSRQYFDAELRFADGETERHQLAEEPEPFGRKPGPPPVALTLSLAMFDVRSAAVALAGAGGQDVRIRFEPNDLGKVAFAATPLHIADGALILRRFDRTIRFRRDRE